MQFQFTTFNLTGLGRLGMGDIISNIHRQMEALGHDCFWSDDGIIDDPDSYVIVFEGFFDQHLEVLRFAHETGSKIIIIGTEAPSEKGFNAGLTEELIVRQRTFKQAVKYACAVWVTVPKAVPWYAQFGVPTAYLELGYAPGSVRNPENVLDHDFGFFGSMTPRRVNLLQKFARERVGDRRALVRYVSFEDGEMRDLQMARCKVILQILQHDAMQGLSTSRVCTALHLGRPVIAEHHADPGVWEAIIKFAHPDVFIHAAIRMLPHWQEIHAQQFDLFKRLLSPEKCVGKTIAATLAPHA